MNFLPVMTTAKLRAFVTALAALAVLATGAIAAGDAGAASGGVGASSSSADETEASATNENRAKYNRLWDRVSEPEKRWARRTSECESGGDPDAIGGGGLYRGAFQFMRSTWKASPKSPGGDPIRFSYRTQAVVAVMLKRRDGAGHWPVCG